MGGVGYRFVSFLGLSLTRNKLTQKPGRRAIPFMDNGIIQDSLRNLFGSSARCAAHRRSVLSRLHILRVSQVQVRARAHSSTSLLLRGRAKLDPTTNCAELALCHRPFNRRCPRSATSDTIATSCTFQVAPVKEHDQCRPETNVKSRKRLRCRPGQVR